MRYTLARPIPSAFEMCTARCTLWNNRVASAAVARTVVLRPSPPAYFSPLWSGWRPASGQPQRVRLVDPGRAAILADRAGKLLGSNKQRKRHGGRPPTQISAKWSRFGPEERW